MIDKQYGKYILMCDTCCSYNPESEPDSVEEFDTFDEAVEFSKGHGWGKLYKGGEWIDICPACLGQ